MNINNESIEIDIGVGLHLYEMAGLPTKYTKLPTKLFVVTAEEEK